MWHLVKTILAGYLERGIVITGFGLPVIDRDFGLVLFFNENHEEDNDANNGECCHNGQGNKCSIIACSFLSSSLTS